MNVPGGTSTVRSPSRIILLTLLVFLPYLPGAAEESRTMTPSDQERSYAVAVRKDTVYLGKGRNVIVLDVSDSASPEELGRIKLPGVVRDVDVDGDRLYVAASMAGLRMIDVSDASQPNELGSIGFDRRADGLTYRGKYVFVAARTAGLQIVDASDPSAPSVIGSYKTEEQAADVAVSEKLAHVAATYGGHRVIDISDLSEPVEIGSAKRGSYNFGFAWGIAQKDGFVYVANVELGIRRVDVSGVDRSRTNNKPPTKKLIQDVYRPADVTVAGDYTYLADQGGGLRIYFSGRKKSETFFEVGRARMAGRAMDVDVSGNIAYVAAREAGLRIVDVSDPFEPSVTGSWDSDVFAVDVAADDTHVFVAGRDHRLWIGDLSSPDAPERTGVRDLPGIEGIELSNQYVFAAAGSNGVYVLDVSDPSRPEIASRVETKHEAAGVTVRDHFLVVSEKADGVELFDVSDPGNPKKRGDWDTDASGDFYNHPAAVRNSVISGDTVFLLYNDGIRVLDASDPGSPEKIGFFPTKERVRRAVVRKGIMYAAFDDGFRTLDVRTPEEIEVLGYYDTPGLVTDVVVSKHTAYITDFDHGLEVLDVSDPSDPKPVQSISPDRHRSHSVALAKGRAYIAADRGGLRVIRLSGLTKK